MKGKMTSFENKRYIDMKKVCNILDITRTTVYKYIKEGRLPVYNIGGGINNTTRFDVEDVQALVKRVPVEVNK
jgi:excisionase family DNA binding protein